MPYCCAAEGILTPSMAKGIPTKSPSRHLWTSYIRIGNFRLHVCEVSYEIGETIGVVVHCALFEAVCNFVATLLWWSSAASYSIAIPDLLDPVRDPSDYPRLP